MPTGRIAPVSLSLKKWKVECLCRRENCGLPGHLDEVDAQHIWLPVGYLNRVEGSDFLQFQKEERAEYKSRLEAVKAYLSDLKSGYGNRYFPR